MDIVATHARSVERLRREGRIEASASASASASAEWDMRARVGMRRRVACVGTLCVGVHFLYARRTVGMMDVRFGVMWFRAVRLDVVVSIYLCIYVYTTK